MQSIHSLATDGYVWEVKTISGNTIYQASRRFKGIWETETFRFEGNARAWAGI